MIPHRPDRCPRCGTGRVVEMLFGPPIHPSRQEDLKAGRAILSGKASTGNDPRWFCLHCRFEWGHPRGISGSSQGTDDLA